MTSLEFVAQIDRRAFPKKTRPAPAAGRIGLQCPQCGAESTVVRALRIDSRLMCGRCGGEAEYRQMREAWCSERRDTLARACPEILFPPPTSRVWA